MKKKVILTAILILAFVVITIAANHASSAIATARANKEASDALEARGRNVGIHCFDLGPCLQMIARAEKNPRLKDAIMQASAEDISIYPDTWLWFSAGSISDRGYIEINTRASDEKIIEFLTKSK